MKTSVKPVMQLRTGFVIVISTICFSISACGTSSPNVPVTGRVTVKGGLPFDEGQMVLIPADSKSANCSATIKTDGSFVCYASSGGTGVPPGKYKVVLTFSAGKGNINPYVTAFRRYTQASTSPLTIDVPPSGLKDHQIVLDEPSAPDESNKTGAGKGEKTETKP